MAGAGKNYLNIPFKEYLKRLQLSTDGEFDPTALRLAASQEFENYKTIERHFNDRQGGVEATAMLGGFVFSDLQADLTAGILSRVHTSATALQPVVMASAGSIVGLSVTDTAVCTGGTATFQVYKNGVVQTIAVVINTTNSQYAYANQAVGIDTFLPGDRLDVRVTSVSFAPALTVDGEVFVWMRLD